jgi:hypothetical protein
MVNTINDDVDVLARTYNGEIDVIAAAKILNFAGMKFPRQIGPDGVRPVGEIRQERSFPLRG